MLFSFTLRLVANISKRRSRLSGTNKGIILLAWDDAEVYEVQLDQCMPCTVLHFELHAVNCGP